MLQGECHQDLPPHPQRIPGLSPCLSSSLQKVRPEALLSPLAGFWDPFVCPQMRLPPKWDPDATSKMGKFDPHPHQKCVCVHSCARIHTLTINCQPKPIKYDLGTRHFCGLSHSVLASINTDDGDLTGYSLQYLIFPGIVFAEAKVMRWK